MPPSMMALAGGGLERGAYGAYGVRRREREGERDGREKKVLGMEVKSKMIYTRSRHLHPTHPFYFF